MARSTAARLVPFFQASKPLVPDCFTLARTFCTRRLDEGALGSAFGDEESCPIPTVNFTSLGSAPPDTTVLGVKRDIRFFSAAARAKFRPALIRSSVTCERHPISGWYTP